MTPADLLLKPKTSPDELIHLRDHMYAADLFVAAVTGMDFFSWLSQIPASFDEICEQYEMQQRPMDVMFTLFASMGLIRKKDDYYFVSDTAKEHLVTDSYWNLKPYFETLKQRPMVKEMLAVLKTGRPANWADQQSEGAWAQAMEKPEFAKFFTSGMDSRGKYLASALANALSLEKYKTLLDVAGGSGIYACALAAKHPGLKATVLEKKPVDQLVMQSVEQKGLAAQVGVYAADMFKVIPDGYDVHLYSNVFHDWGRPQVEALLRRSHDTLNPGGMIVIHDAFINKEKNGPREIAEYSVLLMYLSEGKCYSLGEMESMLLAAGFSSVAYTPTVAKRGYLTALVE